MQAWSFSGRRAASTTLGTSQVSTLGTGAAGGLAQRPGTSASEHSRAIAPGQGPPRSTSSAVEGVELLRVLCDDLWAVSTGGRPRERERAVYRRKRRARGHTWFRLSFIAAVSISFSGVHGSATRAIFLGISKPVSLAALHASKQDLLTS